MDDAARSLFRKEALHHRSGRLHGQVSIATPLGWQIIGYLLFLTVVVATLFLTFASYARIETVGGQIALDRGVANILPSRAGIVSGVTVHEGQRVRNGDVLVTIRADEDALQGLTATQRAREALAEQDRSLTAQIAMLESAAEAERDRLTEKIRGLSDDVTKFEAQIADQERLLAMAENDVSDVRHLAERDFISKRDMEAREAVVIQRRQQLSQLRQQRMNTISAIGEARWSIAQVEASTRAQIATSKINRGELEERLAQVDLAQGYSITAPVSGLITSLTARVGQRASLDRPMMMVVPDGAKLRTELLVPTAAIGFIERGQSVRLAIDAFPVERFGTVSARVTEIASAASTPQTSNGQMPVYLVTAVLDHPYVRAYGRNEPLRPSMTLTARIVTEKRSLLEWLFEPVFAVRNR